MRRLILSALLFCGAALSAHATAPVHVTLKDSATVTADADGYFTLGSISDMSGGDPTERARLRGVPVGRAPLPDQIRHLGPGDVILKLRQAGLHPETEVVLEGAKQISVTLVSSVAPGPSASGVPVPSASSAAGAPPSPPTVPVIHRGDVITILIQDAGLTISAKGTSRDIGRIGDVIHIHRDGVMSDLAAIVIDAQTVQLEL